MRLITTADDQLFQAVSLAGKLGRSKTLLDRLEERYEAHWDDPEVAFPYALALIAALPAMKSDTEIHANFNTTIEVLGEVLSAAPDHWLARYCRARLRSMIPTSYSVYTIYNANELVKAREDLNQLIERQATVEWQPYFASPYLLAALVAQLEREVYDNEVDDQSIAGLVATATAAPRQPVPYPALGAILCAPFISLFDLTEDPTQRQVLGETMTALFPDQAEVSAALARVPAR